MWLSGECGSNVTAVTGVTPRPWGPPQRRHLPDGRVWGRRGAAINRGQEEGTAATDGRRVASFVPKVESRPSDDNPCLCVCLRLYAASERGRHKRHGERDTERESHGRKTVKFYDGDCRVECRQCYVMFRLLGDKRPRRRVTVEVERRGRESTVNVGCDLPERVAN